MIRIILESIDDNALFHITSSENLLGILNSGGLVSDYGKISFTRSKSYNIQAIRDQSIFAFQLIADRDKLKQKYKLIPYIGDDGKIDGNKKRTEYEEIAITKNIPLKYFEAIDCIGFIENTPDDFSEYYGIKSYSQLPSTLDELNELSSQFDSDEIIMIPAITHYLYTSSNLKLLGNLKKYNDKLMKMLSEDNKKLDLSEVEKHNLIKFLSSIDKFDTNEISSMYKDSTNYYIIYSGAPVTIDIDDFNSGNKSKLNSIRDNVRLSAMLF